MTIKKTLIRILDSWIGTLFFILALFLVLMPHTFGIMPFFKSVAFYARWPLFGILFICLCLIDGTIRDFLKNDLFFLLVAIWTVVFCISMHANGQHFETILPQQMIPAFSIIMLMSIFFRVNLKKYMFILFMYCLVITTLNNASVLLFFNKGWFATDFTQEGRAQFFGFAGHINRIYYSVPSMILGIAYARMYDKNWDMVNVANIVFSIVVALAADCISQIIFFGAALIVVILCWIYNRFNGIQKDLRWINAKTIMVFSLLVLDAVVLLGHSGWMEKLGIDPGIHGRRELWDHILETIIDNPVLGVGYQSRIYYEVAGQEFSQPHPHCLYLQIPLETGIIGMIVFIAIIAVIIVSVERVKKFDVRFALGVLCGALFLIFTIECTGRYFLFFFLGLLYYLPKCYRDIEKIPRLRADALRSE